MTQQQIQKLLEKLTKFSIELLAFLKDLIEHFIIFLRDNLEEILRTLFFILICLAFYNVSLIILEELQHIYSELMYIEKELRHLRKLVEFWMSNRPY